MNINTYTAERMKAAFALHKFERRDGIGRLNIFGIRASSPATNKFDDAIGILFLNDAATWDLKIWPATTDPGFYYLNNPMNLKGTAIVMPGQHRDCWGIGLHDGAEKYETLVQIGPIKIWRDKNRDTVIDMDPSTIENAGAGAHIELHRASAKQILQSVDVYSAGCQVLQIVSSHVELMSAVHKHVGLGWEKSFSYALFEEAKT